MTAYRSLFQIFEIDQQVFDGLVAFFAIFAKRARDDAIEIAWSFGEMWQKRLGLAMQNSRHDIDRCWTGERLSTGDHFVEHTTETPDVRAGIDFQTSGLFRRHVMRGAEHHADCGIE